MPSSSSVEVWRCSLDGVKILFRSGVGLGGWVDVEGKRNGRIRLTSANVEEEVEADLGKNQCHEDITNGLIFYLFFQIWSN